ncbi:MAG TPA: CsiV family protein [Gammaproteobacteria bacterium]|nr:CsiV family protein [Gammaproteobacteria bacterium]
MNLPRTVSRLATLLLLGVPLLVLADAPPAAPAPAPNWYNVEVIVFANTDPQAGVLESWPADPGTPDWNSVVPLKPAASGLPYMQLPAASARMNSVWAKLQHSSEYQPLLRSAWAQPAIDRASALFVRMSTAPPASVAASAGSLVSVASAPENSPNAVYGIAKLSTTGPYLHFDLDLVYCGPPAKHLIASTAPTVAGAPPAASASPTAASNVPACQPYRLKEDRRLDAGKLNYFDNPMFGALVLITPRTK